MIWQLSNRFDARAALVADRHYSRQKPGTNQFMPSGSTFVLYAVVGGAEVIWGTSWPYLEYTKHEWAGAWICSIFRNEGCGLSSEMVRQAIAATRLHYGGRPPRGMVTFVDPASVAHKRDPGRCFRKAGFRPVGFSKRRGHLALQLDPLDMPEPAPAKGQQSPIQFS